MGNIVYDIDELKSILNENLAALEQIRCNERYAKHLGASFMERLEQWEKNIRRQRDLPFTIVVCGEFKRGKSSLINALLGEDVAVADVTPETITLNRISYGEHSNALVLPGGKRLLLKDEELRRSKLESILDEHGKGVYQLELKRPIELLKSMTIVDTPGMEDSMRDYSPMVIEALNQADAVLHVVSVNYPVSLSEQLFIRTSILPQKHTQVMVVGNYADTLRTQGNYERMRKEIGERLNTILPGIPYYVLSALDERCRQMGAERPAEELASILESGFQSLKDSLNTLLQEKGAMVLPDRMERMFSGMQEELGTLLNTQEHGVVIDKETLSKEIDEANELCDAMSKKQQATLNELANRMNEMCRETTGWLSEIVDGMRAEVQQMQDADTLDVRKYYSIYCVDTMQDALNRCVEYHLDMIYDAVDRISEKMGKSLSLDSAKLAKQNFRFALHNKSWTRGDNLYLGSTVLTNATGVGGLLYSLATMGISGHMRQKELSGKKDTVLLDVQSQFMQLMETLPRVIEQTYSQLEKELNGQIQDFFAKQIQEVKDNTDQMRTTANCGIEEKQLIQKDIHEVRELLEKMVI